MCDVGKVGEKSPAFFLDVIRPTLLIVGVSLLGAWMLSGTDFSSWETGYDNARMLQLAALGLLIVWGLLFYPKLIFDVLAVLPAYTIWMGAALWALAIASAVRAEWVSYAFIELSLYSALILASHSLRGSVRSVPRLRVWPMFVLSVGAMCLGVRLLADFGAALMLRDVTALASSWVPFINPRYFAKAATWALPLLWLFPRLLPLPWRGRVWLLSTLAAVAIWAQLFGTGSRGALGGMVISLAVAGLFFGPAGRSYARTQLGCLTAGVVLWLGFVFFLGAEVPTRIVDAGASGRIPLYLAALSDIRESPLLGLGPMQFSLVDRHPDLNIAGVHSLPLQLAAEWGLPAAILACWLIGLWFRAMFRTTRHQSTQVPDGWDAWVAVALFSGLLAALIHSLVANVLNDPISQTMACLAAALVTFQKPQSSVPLRASAPQRVAMGLVAVTVLIGLWMGYQKGVACVGQASQAAYKTGIGGSIFPRYWSQGLIPLEQTCG